MTTTLPNSKCPVCNYRMDFATEITGDRAPNPGDISLCFGCNTALVFDEQLHSRLPTPDELLTIKGDAKIIRAQLTRVGMPGLPPLRKHK